jgi:hypothetical protein
MDLRLWLAKMLVVLNPLRLLHPLPQPNSHQLEMINYTRLLLLLLLLAAPGFLTADTALPALDAAPVAEAADALSSADTAWMLTATVLVLFMTLPGLALFYGGLVRSQNVLSVLMHCFAIACLASVLWVAVLYSLAFAEGCAWYGGLQNLGLRAVTIDSMSGTIPETLFVMFQMTFAIITPGLIVGCVCGAHEVQRRAALHRLVVGVGLCSSDPLGAGVVDGSRRWA